MSKRILSKTMIPTVGIGVRGDDAPLGYLLRQANTAHRTLVEKDLAEFNVTLPQYSVLKILYLFPSISNADLARISLLTPQTVCVIVKNLEQRKILQKRPHEIHGRIQQIELTSTGKKLLEDCLTRVDRIQEVLATSLKPSESKIIKKWLINVAKLVEPK